MKRILIAEDEASIREFIVINLKRSGFEVIEAEDGAEAIRKYEETPEIDLAILDIMMPKKNGMEVCKYLRAVNTKIGIIMLTAKTQEMDKVTGLLMGADDYVTKPFSPSELLARIDALYRRVCLASDTENSHSEILAQGEFELNLRDRTLQKNGEPIRLTHVEFRIMEYFLKNPNAALDRNDILNYAWGDSYYGDDKVVDVNVHRLRNKIEDNPAQPKHIITIWGLGYKWIV